tara:strand:- start:4485 stop:4811 length:327 start_codon:yes stop_codon:yes gene_type:complete
MTYEIESTRCRDCGVDTATEEGFVNRIPCGGSVIDCYICGPCTDTLDYYVGGDKAREEGVSEEEIQFDLDKYVDEASYDRYLEDRIKYIDSKYPEAAPFRELWEEKED